MKVEISEHTPVSGKGSVDFLVEEVATWPGVELGENERFGGPVFHYGRRELGHVHEGHGESFADLPFPRRVRDELVATGRARPHHVLSDSGWLTVPIRTVSDLRGALEIFRLSYERASKSAARRSETSANRTEGGRKP
jgi:hypothetical protein